MYDDDSADFVWQSPSDHLPGPSGFLRRGNATGGRRGRYRPYRPRRDFPETAAHLDETYRQQELQDEGGDNSVSVVEFCVVNFEVFSMVGVLLLTEKRCTIKEKNVILRVPWVHEHRKHLFFQISLIVNSLPKNSQVDCIPRNLSNSNLCYHFFIHLFLFHFSISELSVS